MNTNYLKIFKDKKEKQPVLRKIITEFFSKIKLSKRQKIWGTICLVCTVLALSFKAKANIIGAGIIYHGASTVKNILSVSELLTSQNKQVTPELAEEIAQSWSGIDIIKSMLKNITEVQIKSIEKINDLAFGTSTMFDNIYFGLTIFAVIGCVYKLIMHFLRTERFDNVGAFTGFFQFIGIALLFIFSDQIVNHVVGLNQSIDTKQIAEMNLKLDKELSNSILNDLSYAVELLIKNEEDLEIQRQKKEQSTVTIDNDLKIMGLQIERMKLLTWDANLALQFKYIYFSFFISVIASIMAIPSVILSVMIKVLLTVMVAGTKLVFLMAFIPGFENTWKTFMANMVNILLWTPIFNAIYGFVISIVIFMLSEQSLGSGQIVWLTIVACILAFQSVSLTTSAAGVIIQGAGASMAGTLGSMSTMSGVNVAMGVTKAAVGITAMSKFMSKGK